MTTGVDAPLRDDIRLLGRLLGNVLRELEGETMFATVEEIRQTATRFRRDGDPKVGQQLDTRLRKLSRDESIDVVRAFSYFAHLANIAEDRNSLRRKPRSTASSARGSLAHTFSRLQAQGIGSGRIGAMLADACLMPVLTAHPTEVRRKSILDAERSITVWLEQRDGADAEAQRAIDERLIAAICRVTASSNA
ncbi:MAG: phosphoenolpyruvate carboxylase, partial [Burkholderiaceae bacterium]